MENSKREGRAATQSARPHTAAERGARRLSSAETAQMFTDLFTLIGHLKGMDVAPSLLASALARLASVCGSQLELFREEELRYPTREGEDV